MTDPFDINDVIYKIGAPCHAAAFEDRWIAVHYDDCTCSPYRVVYDKRRMRTASSHPEWTPGHSHNDGLRIASKELLKDLWREARRIHLELAPDHHAVDTHQENVGRNQHPTANHYAADAHISRVGGGANLPATPTQH